MTGGRPPLMGGGQRPLPGNNGRETPAVTGFNGTQFPDQEAVPFRTESRQLLGRVISISGSEAKVGLTQTHRSAAGHAVVTVGKFLGIISGDTVIVGMITSVTENDGHNQAYKAHAQLDLTGEIKNAATASAHFNRGITDYPGIGEAVVAMSERDLRTVYGGSETEAAQIGFLQQDTSVSANIRIDEMLSKHFAILGSTGVGKSSGVTIILQEILKTRPNLRLFLVDPHNEYGRCFGDRAQVLTPRNMRLPFWLFNFEETSEIVFGSRRGMEEEIDILAETIPQAKNNYNQHRRTDDRQVMKRPAGGRGYTVDTPVPYRLEDLIALLDERMGKLENRASRSTYQRLITRVQGIRNDPRYSFMFDNANLGGDTMAEVIAQLFRLPANGKPMTIMQMAGFPAEVVDAVVSVLSRMAFDFGLWSDGIAPLLFVCEEAHRYAPADPSIGFAPSRRALSRIAKEGRKYGVFLGLITQRPAEIDPTIISQCSTLFVMRLSNDRDQELIRSAVSDAAANLLTFIPTLGIREVFAFGAGVAVPTRLKFRDLPEHLRPSSEAGVSTNSGTYAERQLISSVIERWRSATTSQKTVDEDTDYGSVLRHETPMPAPPPPQQQQQPSSPRSTFGGLDPDRFRTLKRPPAGGTSDVLGAQQQPQPAKWR